MSKLSLKPSNRITVKKIILFSAIAGVSLTTVLVLFFGTGSAILNPTNTLAAPPPSGSGVISNRGPGGIGSTDGASSLKVWLKSDDLNANGINDNPSDGTGISQWSDHSGNGNHFVQSSPGKQPSYDVSGYGNSVFFNANSGAPKYLNATSPGTYMEGSVYFVVDLVQSGPSNTLFNGGTSSLRTNQWYYTNRLGYTHYGVADYSSNFDSPYNESSVISFHKDENVANITIGLNGASQTMGLSSSNTGIPYNSIGRNSNGADEASGYFYEVLVFNERLNTAEEIIVENYLSSKYNIDIGSRDLYTKDSPSEGEYKYDVAGIGMINNSNVHDDAQGSSVLQINNPSDLNNAEFLFWGHDNNDLNILNSNDVPQGINNRLSRVWAANEVNISAVEVEVGAVDLTWHLEDMGSINENELYLLVDTDGDGVFNDVDPIGGAQEVSSNVFEFPGVTEIEDGALFTIGFGIASLPIELASFDAKLIDDEYVQIDWTTATERNNDYFTIEKSTDGKSFEEIGTVQGAGSSMSALDYSFEDYELYRGVAYYRLRQTDYDGKSEVFDPRSVEYQVDSESLKILKTAPNPFTSNFTISYDAGKSTTVLIELYPMNGIAVFSREFKGVSGTNEFVFDQGHDLSPGMYILTISDDEGNKVSEKLLKK